MMHFDAFGTFAIHEGKSNTRQPSRRALIVVNECFGKLAAEFHAAEAEHGDVVVEVEAGWVLAGVSHAGLALERFEGGDIDEIGGPIALGIAAEIDFVEVERELFAKSGPGAKRQRCTGAVIKVRVDRPLREDDIRL